VGRRCQGMHQHDDVDVGGDRLRLGAIAFERRPPHERAATWEHGLDPVELRRRHDPVTDRYFGTDVAQAHWLRVEIVQYRAPAPVEAGDTARGLTETGLCQGLVQFLTPPESNVSA